MNDSEKIFTGERFVPGIDDDEITIEHFQRYKTVLDLVKNKVVLDAACGEGYGSSIIGTVANQVIGIDLNGEAIDRATANYGNDKVSFLTASVAELPIESNSIDVVVSFETIEHVPEEVQIEFIKEVRRVLKEDGLFIISSPNRAIYSDLFDYHNEFHVHELYKDEFESMLREHFRNIKLFNQYWEVASVIDNNDTYQEKATFVKDRKKYTSDGKYFIALASNADVTDLCLESIYLKEGVTYRSNMLRIVELQDEVERRNAHLKELDDEISRKDAEIVRLQGEEEARNKHIAVLDHNIELMDQNIQTLKRNSELQDAVISAKDASIVTLKEQLTALKEKSDEFEYLKDKAESAVHDKDVHIRNLSAMIEQLNIDILTLNHQINLKENHIQNIEGGYKRWVRISENPLCRAIRAPKKIAAKAYHRIKDGDGVERLVIPKWDKPIVSIVIPVYNQFEYTHACVKSIIETVEDIPYEIIIGDDESTDATRKIKKYINGIRVNMNTSDHGFLMNCNHAAKLARGEYIVFLNNDTQVKEEWLSSLLELIKSDNKIGMVGSKLIYPDGRLQEAGGIIWSDASGWNYGREQNPDMPEYNYVRECDYISGASIMLRRELWEEIGGFDERFKPAYFEDADLAFEVRKLGYKVLYQPRSVVVHFEGVSNGTDLNEGLKRYQVDNRDKFAEKWMIELKNQCAPATEVFKAKERLGNKKVVLFIDHYVPTFDKDAGSRTVYQYIKMFLKRGYCVKFIGDNYAKIEPYTSILEQMGVEIFYGPWYYEHMFEYLKENEQYVDFVFLNRPHISAKYIDFIKNNMHAKVMFYGSDLHYLRVQREAEVLNDDEKRKE
ncbi:MAG: glycosyltransferase, partial [Lachnospira sp.]|nr:glycosyltransferase [Lachnospira sp.]